MEFFKSKRTIFVAIWACTTRNTDAWEIRLSYLSAAIQKAQERSKKRRFPEDQGKSGASSSPRSTSCRRRGRTSLMPRRLLEDDRDAIVQQVRQVSQKLQDFLFVPGTIAFKKNLVRPDAQKRKMDPATAERTGALKTKPRAEKALAAFDNAWSVTDYKDARPFGTMEKLAARKQQMANDIAFSGPLLGEPFVFKNIAYVYLSGSIVYKYSKQADFFETLGDPNVHFIPGGRSCITDIDSIRFGFEVCMDHSLRITGNSLASYKSKGLATLQKPPDIHILLSDYTDNQYFPMRNGGFMLHASTNKNCSAVFYKDPEGKVAMGYSYKGSPKQCGKSDQVGDGPLDYFTIEL